MSRRVIAHPTIWFVSRCHFQQKYIVVCPSSLVSNWAKEFDKWLGSASHPKRLVVKKGGDEGLHQIKVFGQASNCHHSVLILSYDIFRLNVLHFRGISSRLLVVDEGHRLKNTAGSLTLTALESLDCESRLLLTATPIQNVLTDFYTIANFCNPGILGELADFRRDFERPIAAATLKHCSAAIKNKGAEQSLQLERITKTFMLRRLQKHVLKSMLPPRSEVLLFCRPSAVQVRLYQDITASAQGDDALSTLTSLRRLCLHPDLAVAYRSEGGEKASYENLSVAKSGKLAVLDTLLDQIRRVAPADKVVIVSNFTSALGLIEETILRPRKLSFVRLDGSTEVASRQIVVDTFNNTSSERFFCFLLSSKAGGCGLNLTGANRLIMVDPDWNPASDIQAMARVYRQGQEKPCTIYRFFTSGTVEEVICQRQMQKGNLASRAVDSKKGGLEFSKEELVKDCFTLKHVACDTKIKLGKSWPSYEGAESIVACGCDDKPLIQLAASCPSELAFVHVVDDSETAIAMDEDAQPNDDIAGLQDDASMTSEEEWQEEVLNDCPASVRDLMETASSSSEEENVFEW
jgi:SNF2 family DNA or RNA helicase